MSDEDEVNTKSHKQLLQAISILNTTQHIKKSTRDEPKLSQDEFKLAKGVAIRKSVSVNNIVEGLKGTKKLLNAGKQLKNIATTKKVIPKPLEKPASDRIKRTIGYENVKKKLSKWDAVVAKNRSSDTQVFPLKGETIYVNTAVRNRRLQQSIKSDLMMEMEILENKYAQLKREQTGNTDDPKELENIQHELLKKKITKDELMAKRRELAYLKIRESQKSAKARLKNKIKSKKYHTLLKRQKMQGQLKQFELLQKMNPEAAIEKLNALEKSRVLERASLRHKNTGTWAKNLQVRAKYDKDVRKELLEQLQISRQLSQKIDQESDIKENDKMDATTNITTTVNDKDVDFDPFNPWTKLDKNANKVATTEEEQKSNWRKYWLERNRNETIIEEYKKQLQMDECEAKSDENIGKKANIVGENENENEKFRQKSKSKKNIKKEVKKSLKENSKIENGWLVEELDPVINKSIDDIFDCQEHLIKENLKQKIDIINKKFKVLQKAKQKPVKSLNKSSNALNNLEDLMFKNNTKKPIIDDELKFELDERKGSTMQFNETLEKTKDEEKKEENVSKALNNTIDPTKLAAVKLKQHKSGYDIICGTLDDVDMDDEDTLDADGEQEITIAQAFDDDDIVADFNKDKTKDSKIKAAEIQLAMPGWGSWAGAGISKQRMVNCHKRLLLKLAPKEKRRDDNKDGVYINEDVSKKLRNHLVSDIPFPFTSLKDYEASIRAPIGRNFVTETAFRLLTRPSVITQKGKIIEPMNESELLKPQRKKML